MRRLHNAGVRLFAVVLVHLWQVTGSDAIKLQPVHPVTAFSKFIDRQTFHRRRTVASAHLFRSLLPRPPLALSVRDPLSSGATHRVFIRGRMFSRLLGSIS